MVKTPSIQVSPCIGKGLEFILFQTGALPAVTPGPWLVQSSWTRYAPKISPHNLLSRQCWVWTFCESNTRLSCQQCLPIMQGRMVALSGGVGTGSLCSLLQEIRGTKLPSVAPASGCSNVHSIRDAPSAMQSFGWNTRNITCITFSPGRNIMLAGFGVALV